MERINNSSWCCDRLEDYLEELKLKLSEYKESNGENSFKGEIKILEEVIKKLETVFYERGLK